MWNRIRDYFLKSVNYKAALAFFAAFSPAIVLAILVNQNSVNIPVWDGWKRTALFEKFDAGTLTFADLYAPHIDHRMVFPRLLMLVLSYASGGDLRFEVAATFLVGFAAGIGIWKLARHTVGPGVWTGGLTFLANLWIFSPLQYDNWLWPIQTSFMIPMTCLIWAIWATLQTWSWWKRYLFAAALAIIGTHSFSHGLFIWPTVAMLVLLLKQGPKFNTKKWLFAGLWIILAAVIVCCYFGLNFKTATEYGYGREIGSDPPLVDSWQENLTENRHKSATFFLTMLGGPLVRQFAVDPFPPGQMAGMLTLFVYGGFGLLALIHLRKHRDSEMWPKLLPWLALGAAVIAISLGVATGRASVLALARSTVPRLTSVALYLPLSILAMSALWLNTRQKSIPVGVIGFLIALQIQPWLYGMRLMELWRVSRQQAQAKVQFIEHFEPVPIRILAYLPPTVQKYAPVLNAKGWLDPPLVKSLALDEFKVENKFLPKSKGVMNTATPLQGNIWELAGTSLFYNPERPADAVLITAESEGMKSPQIIGLADSVGELFPTRFRIDLQFTALEELLMNGDNTWMQWREKIDLSKLPESTKGKATIIRAWAFTIESRKMYPMPNRLDVAADGTATFVEE